MALRFRIGKALLAWMLVTAAVIGSVQLTVANLQAQSITVGSASAPAGNSVDIDINFTEGDTPVAALQFDLSFSSDLTYTSAQIGDAAFLAGKLLYDNQIIPPPDICTSCNGVRIIIYGVNQTAIGSGKLATIRFIGTKGGTFALHAYGIVSSAPNAQNVPCAGSDGSVTFTKKQRGQITSG